MNKSLFSIIIPVYNVEDYLAECLDSVCRQTYKNIEIICVNDCSTDQSPYILERYRHKDRRIKIITLSKNAGLSSARNAGLDIATGDFIMFLDSDDMYTNSAVETCLKLFEENENVDAVIYRTRFYVDGVARDMMGQYDYAWGNIPRIIDCKKDDCLPVFSNAWIYCIKCNVVYNNEPVSK